MLNISGLFGGPPRTRAVVSLLLCGVLGGFVATAAAQPAYPTKPVRVIVSYGPGTAPDVIARLVSESLQKRLGQPFVVENRPGAGGKIGTEVAANSMADGYTLFLGTKDSQSIMAHLYPDWKIDPARKLTPIASLVRLENVLIVGPSFPAANVQDVLAKAKTKELTYGSPGVGTSMHLMGETLNSIPGVKMLHIPYSRSFAEGFPAVASGEIDMMFAGLPPVFPMIKEGRVKALAITGTKRSSYLPDVPTFAEQGITGLETGGWFGLFAPTGTPAPIINKLNAGVAEVMKEPDLLARFKTMSVEPWATSPAAFSVLIDADSKSMGKLIKDHNIVAK